MTKKEYKDKENDIKFIYELQLHKLKQEYVNSNKKYKVGDFVGNVTGIIKVQFISYTDFMDNIEITYIGYSYRKEKGVLYRTNEKKLYNFWESHNLVKIEGEESHS
jgi:hypothetical protein